MACSSKDRILGQIYCILDYDGNSKDVLINYTLLLLNVLTATSLLVTSGDNRSDTTTTDTCTATLSRRRICAALSLIFASTFQIALCLFLECAGISIIWCAIAGWIGMDYYNYRVLSKTEEEAASNRVCTPNSWHQIIILFLDIIVIVYYAIVMEPITTVAHILAVVVLGIPLHFITDKYSAMGQIHYDSLLPET